LMDVLVFPTHREAFGRAILEAMAMRRAVVAANVGGVPEFVIEGTNGLLVAPHRPDQIADALLRLLQDGALRERLADAAHKDATERFTRDGYLDAIEDVYAMVLRH
ncbi:MAG: glycosyltransferase, partial [Candidatus Brocadiae bacterium]|nr:glycosyltransferase [Candidatus Brocadiia bacterium]